MTETEHLAARVDRLEMRLTEQDAAIEDLNATITAQWRQVDLLTRRVASLVEAMEQGAPGPGGAPEPPPPHY